MENKFKASLSAANDILAEIHVPVDEAIAQLRAFILKTEYPESKAYTEEVLALVLAGRKEQLQKKRQWKEANTTLTALQEAYQLEATETSTEEETVS